ncbi:STAS domain-containing protein [Mycobacterium deserti]|uniref:STAS domain-containing protein n=1 Tax=Mycobacterium deserti TaxID=2978347 RepID=A0ABT2M4U8_9MYCO|nr:STAS domain-containing protein [Mycobacterium deserti]MCT7657291.1 STAS domain-containing protein [Mycobacterium deserti]
MSGRGTSKQVTIRARGEVDASNAKQFADAVCHAAAGDNRITVDLSDVGFMALDGVAALHAVNARMMHADSSWYVVPSDAVSRVLRLCDPEGLIPVAPTTRPTLRLVEPA